MTRIFADGNVRYLTPRARRAFMGTGISLAALQGSGPNGRVVEADVLAGLNKTPSRAAGNQTRSARTTIARRTALSARDIPHFYLQLEISAKPLTRLRQELVHYNRIENNVRISLTDFFIAAVATALSQFPQSNAVWRDDDVEQLPDANVGLVVRTDNGGLLIPVISEVDKQDLFSLASLRQQVVEDARKGSISAKNPPAAVSVSNLGTTRVDSFLPIIDHSQSLMLAVGSVALRPWIDEANQVVSNETVKLCLAADHRVHDGVPAAHLLEAIAAELEHPTRQLIRSFGKKPR